MKTLEQVEPRTDLLTLAGDADYHHLIALPGSYYLTGNLVVTKTNGIQVTAAGVTLDLNGFAIRRGSGAGGDAITIDSQAHRCTVKDGTIGAGAGGLGFGFAYGVLCVGPLNFARGGRYLHLSVSGCTASGLRAGEGWQLDGCTAHDNTGNGIVAVTGSTLTNCTATANSDVSLGLTAGILAAGNCTLTNCTADNNTTDYGIFAGSGSTLTNCSAYSNTAVEFGIDVGSGCTLKNCAAVSNTGAATLSGGIDAGPGCTLIGCAATSNTNTNATASPSTGLGIRISTGSTVRDCTIHRNKGDGIQVNGDRCHIVGNTCTENTLGGQGAGIHLTNSIIACRIDGNHCAGGTRGIWVEGIDNLIVRNSTQGTSVLSYDIAPGNHSAAIINEPGLSFANTSPWANFRF